MERQQGLGDLAALVAADIMSTDLVMVSENESMASAWELLARGRFHHLPVLRRGHLVGVLDDQALVRARTPGTVGTAARKVVGDILPRAFPTVGPDAPFAEVVARLRAEGVDALPVVSDEGDFLGMVTATDVIAALADTLAVDVANRASA
ncbi:MAG: CBS domain-containing protein [Acidimicrobiales bacterium]|nr:CBS domain-containing protein [Acidimicrobiales bacterium]